MSDISKSALRTTAITLLTCALSLPTLASAGEVNLRSSDGRIDLTGELVEYKNGTYLIESNIGALQVKGDMVECFGDSCPSLSLPDTTSVTWDVSVWGKRRAFTEHVEKLAELVSEQTDGLFTLNISYGGLSKSRENLDGIAAGAFEMAQFCAGYHPDKNHAITVLELPFLGVSSLEQDIAISQAVYEHPATIDEMSKWNATLLMPTPLPQYNLIGLGSPPTSLEDFDAMPMRVTGGIGRAMESLGALMVPVPAPQVEEFMNAGVVRAVGFAPHAHMAFNTIENATWWTTNLNPGTVNCPIVVNSDALEGLPDKHRDVLLGAVDEALVHYLEHYRGTTMEAWLPALRERGIMEITINDEIVQSIDDAVANPAAAEWIEVNTARGLPAQELHDLVTGMISAGS